MKNLFSLLFLSALAVRSLSQNLPHLPVEKSRIPDTRLRPAPDRVSGPEDAAIDVLHYDLTFDFPFESAWYTGRSDMQIRILRSGVQTLELHMEELTAGQVTANGQVCPFTRSGDRIVCVLPFSPERSDTVTVSVPFSGAPDRHGFYFYDKCAYTMSEPEDARAWFPCHDVPWDKATAQLAITVPCGVEVASNGLLQRRTRNPAEQTETFVWKTSLPMATYLFCITMSDAYAVWSDWYIRSAGDSIEMPYYIFREDSADAVVDVTAMPEAMAIFSALFGAYPFEKYGTAEVSPFGVGGMEHQTMTTVNASWIRGDRSVENGFVHELAHMWWGDAVTLEDWPDIWLNEGFATYSEALFFEQYTGRDRFQDKVRYMRNQYLTRRGSRDFPVYDPPPGDLFNWAVVYNKAGFVLHMLRAWVGDRMFFNILRTYFQTYLYQNVNSAQFQAVCESVSGRDLDVFFDQWIYQSGCPALEYAWYAGSAGPETAGVFLRIGQVQDTDRMPVFTFPLDLRIHSGASFQDTTLWIRGAFENFVLTLPARPDSIQLDPEIRLLHTAELSAAGARRSAAIPSRLDLLPNFPNPFNQSTTLYYNIPESADGQTARLALYNTRGRQVRLLFDKPLPAGEYWTLWNGKDDRGMPVTSGVYVSRLVVKDLQVTRKVTVVR